MAESLEFSNRSSTALNDTQQEEVKKNLMAVKHMALKSIASLQLTCQKLTYLPDKLLLQLLWVMV